MIRRGLVMVSLLAVVEAGHEVANSDAMTIQLSSWDLSATP